MALDSKKHELRERVEAHYRFWLHALEMDAWRVTFDWMEKITERGQETYRPGARGTAPASFSVNATCSADWAYRDVLFCMSYDGYGSLSDEDARESALHEVLHAAIVEMHEWKVGKAGYQHEERVVVQLAHAISRLV